MIRKKYQGTFNWKDKSFTLSTHAYTEVEAFQNFCNQLADRLGYDRDYMRYHFGKSYRDWDRKAFQIKICS